MSLFFFVIPDVIRDPEPQTPAALDPDFRQDDGVGQGNTAPHIVMLNSFQHPLPQRLWLTTTSVASMDPDLRQDDGLRQGSTAPHTVMLNSFQHPFVRRPLGVRTCVTAMDPDLRQDDETGWRG